MVSFPQQITTELIITDPVTGDTVVQIGPGASIIVGPPPGGNGQIIIVPSQPEPVLQFSTQAAFESNPPNMLGAADIIHDQLQLQLNSGNITAPNNGESSFQLFSPSFNPVGDAKAVLIASNATGSVSSIFTLSSTGVNVDKPETLAATQWQTLTLLNGWTATTEVTNQFKGLRVVYLSNGMARLEGRIIAPNPAPTAGQVIAQLPTNKGYPTIPDHTIQEQVLCTGNANGVSSVDILNSADGAAVTWAAFPAGVAANAIVVVDCMFYVGNGTQS